MITATLDESGSKINILSSYEYKDRIKQIPSATFDFDLKIWQIDRSKIDTFERNFRGEVYYKTPLWKIRNEEAPDYSRLYEIPEDIVCPGMKTELYPYQRFGARFMIDRISRLGFCINADGVGIGKTAQAIATMQWYKENKGARKFLIVCKKSIKGQWQSEISKFSTAFDDCKVIFTGTTKAKRTKAYKEIEEAEDAVLITNFHNFLNDTDDIKALGFDMAVIDEAHCVKAHDGVLNKNIGSVTKNLPCAILTGTPVMSRPEDLYGIIQLAEPNYFGNFWAFRNRYLVTVNKYGFTRVIGVKNLDELRDKVKDVVIRRTNHEVDVQMPRITTRSVVVTPSKDQSEIYEYICLEEDRIKEAYTLLDEIEDKSEDELLELERCEAGLKGYISIKQAAADDPRIFERVHSKMVRGIKAVIPEKLEKSPKTEAILEMVDDIVSADEKVILFSKFVTVGKYYADAIEKELKISVLTYTGEDDSLERERVKELFTKSEEHQVLIGSDAMAEGLNLQSARHVINIDQPDTYAIYTQRLGRARRVSSSYENIVVYNFYTEDTIDMTKAAKLEKDMTLDDALVMANEEESEVLRQASNDVER